MGKGIIDYCSYTTALTLQSNVMHMKVYDRCAINVQLKNVYEFGYFID